MGAYTEIKKDVLIIYPNEPLLFVHGPPVFIKVAFLVEESTSVFILNGEESEVSSEMKQEEQKVQVEQMFQEKQKVQEKQVEAPVQKVTDPSISRRIMYLATPFPRQVYQPLEFVLGDETLIGIIENVEGETITIEIEEGDKEFVSVDMGSIEEILWRGNPFDIN